MKIFKILFLISVILNLSGCGLFNTVRVTPQGTPFLTQKVYPAYYQTDTYGDSILSLISTREALSSCNMKLDEVRKLNEKNQEL